MKAGGVGRREMVKNVRCRDLECFVFSDLSSGKFRQRFDTPTPPSINAQLCLQPAPRKWQVVLEIRGVFILSVLVRGKNRVGCAREAGVDEKNRLFHSINERLCKYSDRLG